MNRHDEKRQFRETKRELKRAGRKKARARAKHRLETAPDEAHLVKDTFGRYTTAHLNGMDRDPTRKRQGGGQSPSIEDGGPLPDLDAPG